MAEKCPIVISFINRSRIISYKFIVTSYKRFMIKKHLPTLLSIVTILFLWQIVAITVGYYAIFPTLDLLFVESFRLITNSGFYEALAATIFRGFVGFALSFLLSLFTGSVAVHFPFWKKFLHPYIVIIRSVPVISVVLVALLWFSPTQLPVFIALLTMFPVLYQSVVNGFEHVDSRLIEMSTVYGFSPWYTFRKIYLPSAKPLIIGGLSTALGFGWRAIIIGEVLAQPLHGIGSGMKLAQVYLNVSELFAWTLAAVVVSYIFDISIHLLSKIRFTKFHKSTFKQHHVSERNLSTKEITFSNLTKSFLDNHLFKNADFQFTSEKVYLLKAPSGKGKTTLLRLLSGSIKPDSGKLKSRNCFSIAYSFQDGRLCNWLTVDENIHFVLSNRKIKNSLTAEEIQEVIEKLELTENLHQFPNELSGGQQQRVALARALVANADMLLLDEPLNGLDNKLKIKIMQFLNDYIVKNKPLVIWATHEDIQLPDLETEEISKF